MIAGNRNSVDWEKQVLPTKTKQHVKSSLEKSGHKYTREIYWVLSMSMGFSGSSDSEVSAYNAGDPDLIPGSGRSPG